LPKEQNRLTLLYFFESFNLGGGRMAGTGYGVLDAVSVLVGFIINPSNTWMYLTTKPIS